MFRSICFQVIEEKYLAFLLEKNDPEYIKAFQVTVTGISSVI